MNAVFAGISEFNLNRVKALTGRLGLPCYIEDAAWKYARDKSAFKSKCREILSDWFHAHLSETHTGESIQSVVQQFPGSP